MDRSLVDVAGPRGETSAHGQTFRGRVRIFPDSAHVRLARGLLMVVANRCNRSINLKGTFVMRKAFLTGLMASWMGLVGCSNHAASTPSSKPADTDKAVAPDNTAVNQRDRGGATVTPPDQQENQADLDITQNVRKVVVKDDALSFDAKNVKIVTANGVVTLRGAVKSDAEKQAIEQKALQTAGVVRVDNQLEVAP
jgi:hyperosmotically inducible protein